MYPVYNIWNYNFIEQQEQQQHHYQQVSQTIDCANKLRDFLDSVDKVEPAYQQQLAYELCGVLAGYAQKHGIF